LWLYRNWPGTREVAPERLPFLFDFREGIAVYPQGRPWAPRLPVLGLRALRRAGLQLHIDCRRGLVNLRTPWRFWPFF
jgi:hypothetical protein